jgi:DNA modification methylase
MCVTSPPYFGLRDYGVKPTIWGGDPSHRHVWNLFTQPAANGIIHDGGMSGKTLSGTSATRKAKTSAFCSCGAWRGAFGLEPSVGLYVSHLVEIFREVWRVLHSTGTLWLNLGDSYASGKGSCFNPGVAILHGRLRHDRLRQSIHIATTAWRTKSHSASP